MNTSNIFAELGIKVGSIIKGKCCQFNSPSNIVMSNETFQSEVTKITAKFIYLNGAERGTGVTKISTLIGMGAWEVVNK